MTPKHPTPDPVTVIDALRGLRYLVRSGGHDLRIALSSESVPAPINALARAVMSDLRVVAGKVDGAASHAIALARQDSTLTTATLQDLATAPDGERVFGRSVYRALKVALATFGADSMLISETAARRAFSILSDPQRSNADDGARLALAMVDLKVVQGLRRNDAATVDEASAVHIACFAVMLWIGLHRTENDNVDALQGAVALSTAIQDSVDEAFARHDASALQGLLDKYSGNV